MTPSNSLPRLPLINSTGADDCEWQLLAAPDPRLFYALFQERVLLAMVGAFHTFVTHLGWTTVKRSMGGCL